MNFFRNNIKAIILGILIGLITAIIIGYTFLQKNIIPTLLNASEQETSLVDPDNYDAKTEDYFLSIGKIKVYVSIIAGIDPSNEVAYDEALKKGVLLMPGAGEIGKPGNTVIYGHSSSNELGNYNVVFAKLNDLENDNEIVVEKEGQRYVYKVTGKKVVESTDLTVLEQTSDQKITLMTCWPIGTDKQRLIVTGIRI
jgi:LPXTG-site transpeptidase (sortase) family protein